jgi:gluconate 2-dehydrogenase gamma chain
MQEIDEKEGANGEPQEKERLALTRRQFLKGVGAAAAAAGLSAVGAGCTPVQEEARPISELIPVRVPQAIQYPEVPYTPAQVPPPAPFRFFTPHEAHTVEAFAARLLPGTPEDPGAREAGVIYYIDNVLADLDGMPEPIYRNPPFAETYAGATPPDDNSAQVIWIPEDEIERYGYQSVYTTRDVVRLGVVALDRYANSLFDQGFAELSGARQDEIIENIVDGEATGFEPLSAESFFHSLRRLTNDGMFSDPVYGGNRDLVGWKLIGYPGAQRSYTIDEVQIDGKAAERPVWGLTDLPHMHPGEPVGPNTVMPVRGSAIDERPQHEHSP